MKCPVCVTPDLLTTERQPIEIDDCPTCRGAWLDRGELDKLIARADDDATERRRAALPARDEPPKYLDGRDGPTDDA
ncbi:zf-TFIIB domain-containing protein [Burkholderia sp. ABCPW 14]|uniref:TFIIB-type zinc ribbon-containing protein n=1 Tax=Burkholderia sp. ABCPW 14 TaxID=1637860 RepID=UPI0009EAA89C